MRAGLPILLLSSFLVLAGCTSSGTGTLALHVTDAPDNIGDFSSLNVTIDKITLTSRDGGTSDHTPASTTFDLTQLTNGNLTTLFNGSVAVGNYTKLTLHVSNAQGVLKASGQQVDVKTPSDQLFLTTSFQITQDQETNFLFDIQVHMEGNGDYILKPNATGSGPKSAADIGAQKAAGHGRPG